MSEPTPDWLDACAQRIRELLPGTPESEALEQAREMWEDRASEDPRRCAEILLVGDD